MLLASSATAEEQTYGSGYEPKPPVPFEFKDYQILPDAISPDRKSAFVYPKRSRLYELENYNLFLAALNPFRTPSKIPLGHSNLAQNARCYYAANWSTDSSTTVFVAGSRWGPEKVWVLQLRAGNVVKKTDLTAEVRQKVMPDYRKSRAERYNKYYDFVFTEQDEGASSWRLDHSRHVLNRHDLHHRPKRTQSAPLGSALQRHLGRHRCEIRRQVL